MQLIDQYLKSVLKGTPIKQHNGRLPLSSASIQELHIHQTTHPPLIHTTHDDDDDDDDYWH